MNVLAISLEYGLPADKATGNSNSGINYWESKGEDWNCHGNRCRSFLRAQCPIGLATELSTKSIRATFRKTEISRASPGNLIA